MTTRMGCIHLSLRGSFAAVVEGDELLERAVHRLHLLDVAELEPTAVHRDAREAAPERHHQL